jgi:hypothetical protein
VREQILALALGRPELSPRELAVTFTDERAYFVSEASVYRVSGGAKVGQWSGGVVPLRGGVIAGH